MWKVSDSNNWSISGDRQGYCKSFDGKGFCVYGTSRKVKGNIAPDASSDDKNNFLKENIIASDKKSGGFICMIPLDVTEEATIAMAVDLVISK